MNKETKLIYAKSHWDQLKRAYSEVQRIDHMLNNKHFSLDVIMAFTESHLEYLKEEIDKAIEYHDEIARGENQ